MSLKDIFEWIINVNLFYVLGVIVVLVAIANINEWFEANKKSASEIFWIFGIMLFLFLLIIVVVS